MPSVLLVDDEKNVLTTLSIGLKRHNYTVRVAQSGRAALQVMEENPCDIVVSDIRMSPMDGFTLVSQLYERYPDINVILMSAYSEDNEKFMKKYSCPRLTKPFKISDLIEELNKVTNNGNSFIKE